MLEQLVALLGEGLGLREVEAGGEEEAAAVQEAKAAVEGVVARL